MDTGKHYSDCIANNDIRNSFDNVDPAGEYNPPPNVNVNVNVQFDNEHGQCQRDYELGCANHNRSDGFFGGCCRYQFACSTAWNTGGTGSEC